MFDPVVRPWAICTDCGEPYPCGTRCPACCGEVRDEPTYRPIVPVDEGQAPRRARLAGLVALGLVSVALTAGCLLALGYFVAT